MTFRLFRYVTLEEINIRRPTVRDIKDLNLNGENVAQVMITLISRVSDFSLAEMEMLDFQDWQNINYHFSEMTKGAR